MPGSITAIDILMEPDATMVRHAEAANARLREVFPKGFSLDETHRPHLTTVQQFVQTANLEEIYERSAKIIADAKPVDWELKAFKYYYLPSNDLGGAGIVVRPNDAWLKMQKELLEAVAPFTVKTATKDAFYTLPGEPELVSGMIEYIEVFASEHSGKNFMPHVTVGVAPREYLDKMLAEPFDEFTFSVARASVYQLGDYGTARKHLKSWTLR
jgi:2'-5' RNA ligase